MSARFVVEEGIVLSGSIDTESLAFFEITTLGGPKGRPLQCFFRLSSHLLNHLSTSKSAAIIKQPIKGGPKNEGEEYLDSPSANNQYF